MLISIHTFLAEGDKIISMLRSASIYFNPHLPRGRWHVWIQTSWDKKKFQSTPSSRKVTIPHGTESRCWSHFNPHLPRGRWLGGSGFVWDMTNFNPHLPRGRWHQNKRVGNWNWYFNPHLPRGRWRYTTLRIARGWRISIHTFLAEGDQLVQQTLNRY